MRSSRAGYCRFLYQRGVRRGRGVGGYRPIRAGLSLYTGKKHALGIRAKGKGLGAEKWLREAHEPLC